MAEIIRRRIIPGERPAPRDPSKPRPKINYISLGGFRQDDFKLIGGGDMALGIAKYFEEMHRLLQAGELTPGTRIFGAELDALRGNPIPPMVKEVEN